MVNSVRERVQVRLVEEFLELLRVRREVAVAQVLLLEGEVWIRPSPTAYACASTATVGLLHRGGVQDGRLWIAGIACTGNVGAGRGV